MKTNQGNYQEETYQEVNEMKSARKNMLKGGLLVSGVVIFLILGFAVGYIYFSQNNSTSAKGEEANGANLPGIHFLFGQNNDGQPARNTNNEDPAEVVPVEAYDEAVCPECEGVGEVECTECAGAGNYDCEVCEGGTITESHMEDVDDGGVHDDGTFGDAGGWGVVMDCATCAGFGYFECADCGGDGQVVCDNCGGEGYL